MRITSKVPGKCILFGEHAVVYNFPAISMAIPLNSTCTVEENKHNSIEINFKTSNEKYEGSSLIDIEEKIPFNYSQFILGLNSLESNFDIIIKDIKIELSSDIITNAGLGSSASTSIALISAVSEFYDLTLKKAEILNYVLEMEKVTHGTPSGIDHTTCLYGNIIYYQKGRPFHFVYPPDDFYVLITYTNQEHNTKEVISNVKKLKDENSHLFDSVVDKIGFYTGIAELELVSGNYEEVGKLMNFNQDLLSQLNVSNATINKINEIALKNGAYGSKLTGAGLGGCVITLGEEKVLKKISKIFKSQGYWNFLTTQDKNGPLTTK